MALRLTLAVAFALTTIACGGRQTTLNQSVNTADDAGKAKGAEFLAQADAMWKERGDRAKAEGAIKAYEDAGKADPSNVEVQRRLIYAYYFVNQNFVHWDDNDDVLKANYSKGVAAAERALSLANPVFAKKITDGDDSDAAWNTALQAATKEDVPALYWYATNLAKWALKEGITSLLKYKDRAYAIMQTCKKLDNSYFYGGPSRYLGAYWLKIPFGKSPEKSKSNFEAAMKAEPNYLSSKTLFAEIYAVRTENEDLFKKTLQDVVNAADDVHPDLIPENQNAKRLAKEMLENMDEFF